MTRTVEELAHDRMTYKNALRDALTKMEGLYRIIYGYNKLDEKPSDNQEYIAMNYVLETRRALADENGWTGRKCPVCHGTGGHDFDKPCKACGGTSEENIGAVRPPTITEDAPEATPAPQMPERPKELVLREDDPYMLINEHYHGNLKPAPITARPNGAPGAQNPKKSEQCTSSEHCKCDPVIRGCHMCGN